MQTIDTRGKLCPAPLIITKKAIKESAINTEFTILCDNETAKDNLLKYLIELTFTPTCEAKDSIYHIRFTKTSTENITTVAAESYCNTPKPYVVCVKNEYMGGGDPILGAILMRAFINSLPEAETLPSHIVIYNTGIRIAIHGCDTAKTLQTLSDKGVKIILCGTCVDFYEAKSDIAVGTIGNMYHITEILTNASHVIYP